MKRLLTTLALAAAPALGCAAPPTDASLAELFRLMRAESLMDAVMAQTEAQLRQNMAQMVGLRAGQPLSDAQRRVMDTLPGRMTKLLREELSWARLEPMQTAVFRDTFDQAEVDGLIAFYGSPVGQAYVAKMPLAMQKTMTATQTMMMSFAPKVAELVEQVKREAQSPAAR